MKINLPITNEDHQAADAEYAQTARNQKRYLNDLARKIENGEPLERMDRSVAAAVIRSAAKNMSEKRPRPAGHQAQLPDFELVFEYAERRHAGMAKLASVEDLSNRYYVSAVAVKKRLGMVGNDPEAISRREEVQGLLRLLGIDETK